MIKLYHAEPMANSLKCLIPLFEKKLKFESVYVDLHKFEQHDPAFLALNPEGQVPVLDHDGTILTQTSVINEYLEDVFPDTTPLRPRDPLGAARMRYWNKFIDEHVMNYVSIHGWHRFVGVLARSIEGGEFDRLMARIPLHEQREKWRGARSGYSQADLDNATRKVGVALEKVEEQLGRTPWLAGDSYSLADINFYAHCGAFAERMFPNLTSKERHPRLANWVARVSERPAVKEALSMPDHTNPALRTFTGEAH